MSAELRVPLPLNDLPLRNTLTPENGWQQSWRQVGWWNTKTFEVRSMVVGRPANGPWIELWLLAIDAPLDRPGRAGVSEGAS